MHIATYIQLVHRSEQNLAKAFRFVAESHQAEPDIAEISKMLAGWSERLIEQLQPITEKYGEKEDAEADDLFDVFFDRRRKGALALLQNLQDLWLMVNEVTISAIILHQAASGLKDKALISLCTEIQQQSKRQAAWLLTRIKSSAPQALIAAE